MSLIHEFGATGKDNIDDTESIIHAIKYGDGQLECKRGEYVISKTIEIELSKVGRIGLDGSNGTAKFIMKGAGPAFRIIGTHKGSAHPSSVKDDVWKNERHPIISNVEIEGAHPEADGIEITGVFQPRLDGVLLHRVRHGIILTGINRNVIISNCNIYHNTGIGVYCKKLNLHQINIIGNHISYNRLGGIRIEDSEIRNLQITGNDIEYNNHKTHGTQPEPTAEIYIDSSKPKCTVAEVTIASNTIQATISQGGSNIRIIGPENSMGKTNWEKYPPCLISITGNVISSQEINVHLTGCNGLSFAGNSIAAPGKYNILCEDTHKVTFSGDNFRPHWKERNSALKFTGCQDIIVNGCYMTGIDDSSNAEGDNLLEISKCNRFTLSNCQIVGFPTHGIEIKDSSMVNVNGCTLINEGSGSLINWSGQGKANVMAMNILKSKKDISHSQSTGLSLVSNTFEEA